MARRSHTTDTGSIACVDLGELGAGKEGWLIENPNLLFALDTHSLSLANCSIVLLLERSNNASDALSSWVRIRSNLSPIEVEYISDIEWLVFDDVRVLALGTSCGYLLIYSLNGQLIHKQEVLVVDHGLMDKLAAKNEKLKSLVSSLEVKIDET